MALATGRRYDFARPIFEPLPAPLTLILSNGAVVKNCEGEDRDAAPAAARDRPGRARDHARTTRETAAVVFDRPREGQVVFEAIDWEHPRHRRFFEANRRVPRRAAAARGCLTEDPIQVMFTGGCAEMRQLFDGLRGWQRRRAGMPRSPSR